ncbi:NAD(P)-dependent oxidoreductase [Intrasporangium sp. YIM S08009]|uniref:NAD-dependent epimerase/dehydratase family protein n=1 Tax=Intrasporangium zincisolvens TaxID=3080018 RepID=UPI002B0550D0|nr:NAD(P)-dependent oxidoreductase [Intrasporangium sp. YIM S08009]
MARIALTGAAGRIATSLRPRLHAAGHDLVLLDAVRVPDAVPDAVPGAVPGERVVEADLRDVEAHADAFAGADLVVHLGGLSDERPWADLLAVNVDGTRAVLDAVVRAGVGRVLLASSVHAAGYVPVDDPATAAGMPLPAPDTYYGASKAAVEALGGLYAGRFGLTVVSARIMTFGEEPSGRSSLRWWLSADDMARLVDAVRTTDAGGHHVVWGVSANARGHVDPGPGAGIGFVPVDDAQTWVDEGRLGADVAAEAPRAVLGGGFADPAYRLGEAHGGAPTRT